MTDSKTELDPKYNLDLKNQDVRIDSSFSIRTDYSMDMGENNEKHLRRKQQKQIKDSSKVTFDDSLNTDLMYDPSLSSIHPTKVDIRKEKSKKQQEFISVYSGRPIEEPESPAKNIEKTAEKNVEKNEDQKQALRKSSLNLEYKPEKTE